MPGEKEVLKTTCPRDCYGRLRHRRDQARRSDHPRARRPGPSGEPGRVSAASARWPTMVSSATPEVRLQTPLKRAGAKGEGRFEPVSWNEAIGDIAARFKAIAEGDGADKIVHAHYTGTCSLIANTFPMRFLGRLGAREVEPDTVCNMAGHVALDYVIGTSVIGFDPRTAKDANSIVVWGANPSASAPHQHKHWLKEAPGTVIVIDPVRHPTAEQADMHLQPFPGSDAALAFALVNVLVRDGLIDRAFLDAHTLGWDELEPAIAPCTPAWGEARTGVPAAQIEEAARIYGAGPALLWLGQGLQRQAMGGNVMRACALLPAVTGNFGKPGAGMLYLNGSGRKGVDGGLSVGRGSKPEPAELQPDGACGAAGRSGGHPGLPLLEHQPGGLQPGAGAVPPRAHAGRPLHRGPGHLPDRHSRLCRLRAAGGVVPGIRRPGFGLFQPLVLRPGQAAGAARRLSPPTRRSFGASPAPWATPTPSSTKTMRRSSSGSWARWVSRAPSMISRRPAPCFPTGNP